MQTDHRGDRRRVYRAPGAGDGRAPAGHPALRALLHRDLAGGADRRFGADRSKRSTPRWPRPSAILQSEGATRHRLLHRRGQVRTRCGTCARASSPPAAPAGPRAPRCSPRTWRRRSTGSPISSSTCGRCSTSTAMTTPSSSAMRLAGNLHFQMSDNFMEPGAAEKFDRFSKDLAELVSVRYGGSLKAEHGTGRAIAPFVEAEWGNRGLSPDAPDQGAVRPRGPAQSGRAAQSRPGHPRQESEADAAGRPDRRPVHRMRLLRAGLPQRCN